MYVPFNSDFGPLNLGQTYRFVTELQKLVKDPKHTKYQIFHWTSTDSAKRANACFLMGAFMILVMKKTATEAWAKFQNVQPPFMPFRDALKGSCSYACTVRIAHSQTFL